MGREFVSLALEAIKGIVEQATASCEKICDNPGGLPIDYDYVQDLASKKLASCVPTPSVPSLCRIAWELVWTTASLWVKESCSNQREKLYITRALVYLEVLLFWCEHVQQSGTSEFPDESTTATLPNLKGSIFLTCLEVILQISTLGCCAKFLEYFYKNLLRLTPVCLNSQTRKRQLLSIMTSLLRRANTTLYPEVVSFILQICTQVFDSNDKSMLNVKCTLYAKENVQIDSVSQESKLGSFYKLLWDIHSRIQDPKSFLSSTSRPLLKSIFSDIEFVLVKFAQVGCSQKEHVKNSQITKAVIGADMGFSNSRFFTSFELFEAQIADPHFRRQFLVQFLIFLRVLSYYSAEHIQELTKSFENDPDAKINLNLLPKTDFDGLNATEISAVKTLEAKIAVVLCRIPPAGVEFLNTSLRLIRDEFIWMSWKLRYCQKEIIKPVATVLSKPRKYSLKFGVDELERDFGSSRLNIFRNARSSTESVLSPVFEIPDMESWTEQVEFEAKDEIERDYQLSRKEQWKWQTKRFFIGRDFSVLKKPKTNNYFLDLSRRHRGLPEVSKDEQEAIENENMRIEKKILDQKLAEDEKFRQRELEEKIKIKLAGQEKKMQLEKEATELQIQKEIENEKARKMEQILVDREESKPPKPHDQNEKLEKMKPESTFVAPKILLPLVTATVPIVANHDEEKPKKKSENRRDSEQKSRFEVRSSSSSHVSSDRERNENHERVLRLSSKRNRSQDRHLSKEVLSKQSRSQRRTSIIPNSNFEIKIRNPQSVKDSNEDSHKASLSESSRHSDRSKPIKSQCDSNKNTPSSSNSLIPRISQVEKEMVRDFLRPGKSHTETKSSAVRESSSVSTVFQSRERKRARENEATRPFSAPDARQSDYALPRSLKISTTSKVGLPSRPEGERNRSTTDSVQSFRRLHPNDVPLLVSTPTHRRRGVAEHYPQGSISLGGNSRRGQGGERGVASSETRELSRKRNRRG